MSEDEALHRLGARIRARQRELGLTHDWFLAEEPRPATSLEQLAAEVGVDPGRLRAVLERVLFGGR